MRIYLSGFSMLVEPEWVASVTYTISTLDDTKLSSITIKLFSEQTIIINDHINMARTIAEFPEVWISKLTKLGMDLDFYKALSIEHAEDKSTYTPENTIPEFPHHYEPSLSVFEEALKVLGYCQVYPFGMVNDDEAIKRLKDDIDKDALVDDDDLLEDDDL